LDRCGWNVPAEGLFSASIDPDTGADAVAGDEGAWTWTDLEADSALSGSTFVCAGLT
jgi:hypothetical protein